MKTNLTKAMAFMPAALMAALLMLPSAAFAQDAPQPGDGDSDAAIGTATPYDSGAFRPLAMQIFVVLHIYTGGGVKHITLEVEPSDRIEDIKAKIQDKEGIPPERQILAFNGVRMDDGYQLQDYGVAKDAYIHMYMRTLASDPIMGETAPPPPIYEDEALSPVPPAILNDTLVIDSQGWQISRDSFATTIPYTGQTLDISYDGWMLRYWIGTQYQGMFFGNAVAVTVMERPALPDGNTALDAGGTGGQAAQPPAAGGPRSPKTGDGSHVPGWLASLVAALFAGSLLLAGYRRRA